MLDICNVWKRVVSRHGDAAGNTGASIASADVPQQKNCFDCGLFALAFAERLAELCTSRWQSSVSSPAVDATEESLLDKPSLQELVEKAASCATQDAVSMMRGSIQELIQQRSNRI